MRLFYAATLCSEWYGIQGWAGDLSVQMTISHGGLLTNGAFHASGAWRRLDPILGQVCSSKVV